MGTPHSSIEPRPHPIRAETFANYSPSALHPPTTAHPHNSTLRFECSSAFRPAVCGVGAQSCSFSRYEGEAPLSKAQTKRRRHDDGETDKTISRYSEMVSATS